MSTFGKRALPTGYTQVEYIESTGTQYIDTGYSAPEGFITEAEVEFTSLARISSYVVGSHNASAPYGRNGISYNSNLVWEIGTGDTSPVATVSPVANTRYVIKGSSVKGNSYMYVNGELLITSTDTSARSTHNLLVFYQQYNMNRGSATTKAKLYQLKIYAPDNTMVRDFIPCINPKGVYGLYDRANGVFYTNAGSGTFIAGKIVIEAGILSELLITDRANTDVSEVVAIAELIKAGTATAEQVQQYITGTNKGAYGFMDMNRVESAVQTVNDYLNDLQGNLDTYREASIVASDPFWLVPFAYPVTLETKTDWSISDLPTGSDFERYLRNVSELTDRIPIEKNLPTTMDRLTIEGANEIERAILAEYESGQSYETETKRLIDNTAKSYVYSGEIFGGEV